MVGGEKEVFEQARPALEAMGIHMLLNEFVVIERGDARIHLAGIDDAHFFRVDNIEKAGDAIPQGGPRDRSQAALEARVVEIGRDR